MLQCLPGPAVADVTAWGWGRAAAADSKPQRGTCLLWKRCVAGLATCPAAARVIYGVCARSRLAPPPHAPKSVYLCFCKYFLDYPWFMSQCSRPLLYLQSILFIFEVVRKRLQQLVRTNAFLKNNY